MTSRPVGRVSRSDADPGLAAVGDAAQAIDMDQASLIEAVRQARAGGVSWARVGHILNVTRQAAQQRFGPFMDEPADAGLTCQPEAPPAEPASPPPPAPTFDFSDLVTMTSEQLVGIAAQLPTDEKIFDPYLRAKREAIVIALYRRNWTQRQIATVIGKTNQRVSQIVVGYYNRQEKEWEEERVRRRG